MIPNLFPLQTLDAINTGGLQRAIPSAVQLKGCEPATFRSRRYSRGFVTFKIVPLSSPIPNWLADCPPILIALSKLASADGELQGLKGGSNNTPSLRLDCTTVARLQKIHEVNLLRQPSHYVSSSNATFHFFLIWFVASSDSKIKHLLSHR